jgi:hypothetical protein
MRVQLALTRYIGSKRHLVNPRKREIAGRQLRRAPLNHLKVTTHSELSTSKARIYWLSSLRRCQASRIVRTRIRFPLSHAMGLGTRNVRALRSQLGEPFFICEVTNVSMPQECDITCAPPNPCGDTAIGVWTAKYTREALDQKVGKCQSERRHHRPA